MRTRLLSILVPKFIAHFLFLHMSRFFSRLATNAEHLVNSSLKQFLPSFILFPLFLSFPVNLFLFMWYSFQSYIPCVYWAAWQRSQVCHRSISSTSKIHLLHSTIHAAPWFDARNCARLLGRLLVLLVVLLTWQAHHPMWFSDRLLCLQVLLVLSWSLQTRADLVLLEIMTLLTARVRGYRFVRSKPRRQAKKKISITYNITHNMYSCFQFDHVGLLHCCTLRWWLAIARKY